MLNQWDRRSLICWRLDLDLDGGQRSPDVIQGSNVAQQHPMAVSRGQSLVVTAPRFAPNYAASIQVQPARWPEPPWPVHFCNILSSITLNYTKHRQICQVLKVEIGRDAQTGFLGWTQTELPLLKSRWVRWTAWWRNGMPRLKNVKSMSCTKYTSSEREKTPVNNTQI